LKHLIAVIRRPAIPGQRVGADWNWRAVFLAFGSMVAYLAATLVFGMVLSSAVIVYGAGLAFGAKSKSKLALITGATVAAVYLLFVVALRVPLYPGLLANLSL
jgi:Tripartite tricarboxylate transporter TctB family